MDLKSFLSQDIDKISIATEIFPFYGKIDPNFIKNEASQNFTLTRDGRVFISFYIFDFDSARFQKLNQREIYKVDVDQVEEIFEVMTGYLSQYVTHVIPIGHPAYGLKVRNEAGKELFFNNMLGEDPAGLSDLIRKKLGRQDLLLMDGNPNYIAELTVEYEEEEARKEILQVSYDDASIDYQVWSNQDIHLQINHVQGLTSILEELAMSLPDHPGSVVINKKDENTLIIKAKTKHGQLFAFDRETCPQEWPHLIENMASLIDWQHPGQIFSKSTYIRPGDLIFCQVKFKNGNKVYTYLTDDSTLKEGDLVLVPVQSNEDGIEARVVGLDIEAPQDLDFPLEELKHVIKKVSE